MQFLCIQCDEAMAFMNSGPTDGGNLQATFTCPSCNQMIAMLLAPNEAEQLESLGVDVPHGTGPAAAAMFEPGMGHGGEGPGPAAGISMGMSGMGEMADAPAGKCPFSGMAATDTSTPVDWTADALARLENIPETMRDMAKQGIEHFARSSGLAVIDDSFMEAARNRLGM